MDLAGGILNPKDDFCREDGMILNNGCLDNWPHRAYDGYLVRKDFSAQITLGSTLFRRYVVEFSVGSILREY